MTVKNTVWLYPKSDIKRALDSTNLPFTFDGTNLVCPDITTMRSLYEQIFTQTAISQPVGNVGFSIGVGSILEDMNDSIYWKLPTGHIVIKWQLVKQITPQLPEMQIVSPGNSLPNTVGYTTTFTAFTPQLDPIFDAPFVIRI